MANQYLAKLGILLSVDSAEMSKGFKEAGDETKKFNRLVESESKKAISEIYRMRDAIDDYGKEVTMVTKMEREFRDGGRYANLAKNEAVRQSILKEAAAVDALAASQKKASAGQGIGGQKAGGLTPYQIQALSYQTTDIVTSLAGGQSPWLVMLQQGGQLKDQFGGVTNVFKAFGQVLTVANVAMGALAGTAGVLAFAFYKGHNEVEQLNKQLILTNNYAGLSQTSFQRLSEAIGSIAYGSGVGVGSTKDIFMQMASSGKMTLSTMIPVAEVIGKIAKLSGQAADAVAKELLPSFDGSVASARRLDEQYHFLTLSELKRIELLEQQNKKQQAAAYYADLLRKKLDENKQSVGALESAYRSSIETVKNWWDAVLDIGRPATDTDKLSKIAKQIETVNNRSNLWGSIKTDRLKSLTDEYMSLAKKMADDQVALNDKTAKTVKEQQEKDAYERAGGLARVQELEFQSQKRIIDNNINMAEVGATEQEKIGLEAVRKMAHASIDLQKKLTQSGYGLAKEEFKAFEDDKTAILADAERQRFELSQQESKKFQNKQAIEQLAIDKEKEKLELYQKNILLSDQDLQIAMDRLQMEKNIAEIQNSKLDKKDIEKYSQRERDIQQQKEAVAALGDKLKMLRDIHSSVFNNMGSAIEKFVKTGKFAFKDFAQSVIQDILAIIIKAQVLKMMSGASSLLGNMFSGGTGGGAATDFLNAGVSYGGFGLKASGGSVTSGSPTIVGERGAELFIPNTSGTIVPNNQLNDSMGGTTTVNNYNINAIDTKSFEERIFGSSNAIWTANQYAQKNLATTGGRA